MQTKINSTNIASTGVTAGSYTNANITVNESGQITSASNGTGGGGGGGGGTGLQFTTYTYTANGTTTIYNASSGITVDTVLVILDGVTQTPTSDYTVSANTVVFTSAPPSGSQIQIRVLGDVATTTVPKITAIQVTDSSYNVLDDTAVSTSGGYIKITGTGFATGPQVVVGSLVATSISYISSTELRCQIPAQAAGTYTVYVTNSDSSVAIRVNGLNYSSTPTWSTTSPLPNGTKNSPISIQLAASSNTSVTYALASGSTLPTGLSLTSGGLLSGTVSTITVETTYNFTIVATDGENQDTPQAFQITIVIGDPYFSLTSLLLSDSALSANTVIKDSSTNNFNLTAYGDSRASNFTPYGTGWSVQFDGTGDYLSISTNAALNLSSGDFTIEGWAYWTGSNSGGTILNKDGVSGSSFPSYLLSLNGSGYFRGVVGSGNGTSYLQTITSSVLAPINQWVHLAFVKNGTTLTLYQNGTNVGSATQTGTIVDGAKAVLIGYETGQGSTVYWSGYISNTRIVKGTALYTANFTPATTNLTAVANTSLLTCNANRFLDSSTNNFAITPNGDAKVVSFNPFNITNTGVNGSAYFDGTGDYLSTSANTAFAMGTGDFTVEFWYYPVTYGSSQNIISHQYSTGFAIGTQTSGTEFYIAGSFISTATRPTLGMWNHVVCQRASGTASIYFNGTRVQTGSLTGSVTSTTALIIGAAVHNLPNEASNGYLSDIRIVKGSAVYSGVTITPPAAPLSAIANTSLLTCQYRQPHNNHTFLDSSSNQFLITRNGNTTQGTFSPFSQTGWGAYFDGSNDNVSFASGSQVIPATGDFTIEAWIYPTSVAAGVYNVIYAQTNGGASAGRTQFITDGSNVAFQCGGTYLTSSSGTLTANRWNYVAATRTGSSVSIYVNGSATTGLTASGSIDSGTSLTAIGANWSPQYMAGYISNFRVSTTIRSNLTTVPTSPFTNDANTRVLTLQNNRFIDNSSSPFTLTANNGVAITPFSPFAPTAAYTTAAVGGSGYFDGTGDYLTTQTSSAFSFNADFTIECWVYSSSLSTSSSLYIVNAGGVYLALNLGTTSVDVYLNSSGVSFSSSATIPLNAWNHIAMVRSGSIVTIYVNGNALPTTGSNSATLGSSSSAFSICGLSGNFPGYLSNFRIVKGTAVYTGNFTPPTKLLAASGADSAGSYPSTTNVNTSFASSACSLLLNFTNAGITDATAKNDLETVGDAKISTAQSKWGGGSMYFDGTGDYLYKPYDPFLNQLNGNFTMECWIYPTATSTRMIFAGVASAAGDDNWFWEISSGNKLRFNWTNTTPTGFTATSTASISPNTWTYIAVVKNGGTITQYINGSADGTSSPTGTYRNLSNGFGIGRIGDLNGLYFTGYIDDFRMTIGQARTITASPTAPFPVQ